MDVDPCDKRAERPECVCRVECDEACLNRAMFYECDDENCALNNPEDCSNRAFQRAAIRYADHKARSCGFEVFKVNSCTGGCAYADRRSRFWITGIARFPT